jgi:hypothetical protein
MNLKISLKTVGTISTKLGRDFPLVNGQYFDSMQKIKIKKA